MKIIKKLIVIFIMGIIATISIQYFITPAQTVPTEIMGVTISISSIIFCFKSQNYFIFFWCTYFLILLPFTIFGYFKVGKLFTCLTLFFTAVTTVTGVIFSKTLPPYEIFGSIKHKLWLRFIYSTIGAGLYGAALGFTLMQGGSSNGTDFIAAYFSRNKKINISLLLVIFAIFTLIIATIIFEIFGFQHKYLGTKFSEIDYLKLFITFLFSLWQCICGPIVIYFIFKKGKEIKIILNSKNINKILKYLETSSNKNYIVSHSKKELIFIALLLDKKIIKKEIKQIDDNVQFKCKHRWSKHIFNVNIWE